MRRVVVEDTAFEVSDIEPLLHSLVLGLLRLQAGVAEVDSKQTVLTTLVSVLHATHDKARPFIAELVPILNHLWVGAPGQPVFRGTVMHAVTEIIELSDVQTAGALATVAAPIIREALVGHHGGALMDEGLAMLRATLTACGHSRRSWRRCSTA